MRKPIAQCSHFPIPFLANNKACRLRIVFPYPFPLNLSTPKTPFSALQKPHANTAPDETERGLAPIHGVALFILEENV
jgi:hypothetical protein